MSSSNHQLFSRDRARGAFSIVFHSFAILLLLIYAILDISGSNNFFLYFTNDLLPVPEKSLFVLGFSLTYVTALVICSHSLTIPSYDSFNKIVVISMSCLTLYATVLAISRISLLSRTVFLVELILTTLLLMLYFLLRFRMFPTRIAISDKAPQELFEHKNIEWVKQGAGPTSIQERVDLVAVDDESPVTQITQNSQLSGFFFGIPRISAFVLLEELSGKVKLSSLTASVLSTISPPRAYFLTKRIGELVFVIVLSPLVFVLCLLLGTLIKIDSAGPMLFRQRRTGLNGKEFWITKLRTMTHDLTELPKERFATEADQRITQTGRWIREYRLDELPQFWNVLSGEMSLIGPRPEQPEFVRQFRSSIPLYDIRHTVRPGITGWAQIRYGYASSEEQAREKLEYDLFYIKHMSAWLDFNIVLRTLTTIVLRKGAR